MSKRTRLTQLLIVAVLSFPLTSLAENKDNKRGRYPDGTAYRTDTQGYKLADHIAELEVTVDDLRKQVAALEDELAAKDKKIGKAAAGIAPVPLVETSLTSARPPQPATTVADAKPTTVIDAQCMRQNEELSRELGQLRLAQQAMNNQQQNCQTQTAALREQVTQLQTALMRGPSKELVMETSERGKQLETSVESLQAAISEKEANLARLSEELAATKDKLAARDEREEELVKELAGLQASTVQPIYSRTSPGRATMTPPAEKVAEDDDEDSDDQLAAEELGKAKKTLGSSLDGLQKLIHQRKELLDSAKSRRREVSVKIQPLVSKSGESLDALRVRVRKMKSQEEVDAITRGLGEIRSLLDQDIALLRRLT